MSPWFIVLNKPIDQFLQNPAKFSKCLGIRLLCSLQIVQVIRRLIFNNSLCIVVICSTEIQFYIIPLEGNRLNSIISFFLIIEILKHNNDISLILIAYFLAAGTLLILKISNIDVEVTISIYKPQASIRNKEIVIESTR